MNAPTEPQSVDPAPHVATRLKILVTAHLAIGTLPILAGFIPLDVRFLPLLWTCSSIGISQIMLLSFWAAMGTSRVVVRIASALAGIAYVAAWLPWGMSLHENYDGHVVVEYLQMLALDCGIAILLAAIFLAIRRWWFQLGRPVEAASSPEKRFQFSILHLLVIASVASLVLALVQAGRRNEEDPVTGWHELIMSALVLLAFLVNLICAVRAALGSGRPAIPILLSLVTATLLGAALAISLGHDRLGGWVFAGSVLGLNVPTILVITSLLVVRSCGYRVVPSKH